MGWASAERAVDVLELTGEMEAAAALLAVAGPALRG